MISFFTRNGGVRRLLKRKDSDAGERAKALNDLRASLFSELRTSEGAKRLQQRACSPTIALSFNFFVSVGIIMMNKLVRPLSLCLSPSSSSSSSSPSSSPSSSSSSGSGQSGLQLPHLPHLHPLRGELAPDGSAQRRLSASLAAAGQGDPLLHPLGSRHRHGRLHRSRQRQLEVQQRRVLPDGEDSGDPHHRPGGVHPVPEDGLLPQGGGADRGLRRSGGSDRHGSPVPALRSLRGPRLDRPQRRQQGALVQLAAAPQLDCPCVDVEDDADDPLLPAHHDPVARSPRCPLLPLERRQLLRHPPLRSSRVPSAVIRCSRSWGNVGGVARCSGAVQDVRRPSRRIPLLRLESGSLQHRWCCRRPRRHVRLHVSQLARWASGVAVFPAEIPAGQTRRRPRCRRERMNLVINSFTSLLERE